MHVPSTKQPLVTLIRHAPLSSQAELVQLPPLVLGQVEPAALAG